MGRDKAEIAYAQLPQWRAVEELLRPLCAEVFWSCTPTQQSQWGIGERAIIDVAVGHGPASGLHAAFTSTLPQARNMTSPQSPQLHNSCAWLVVGCDYPLLQLRDLQSLLDARDPNADAVVFFDKQKNEIEPMIAVWEPSAQAQFLAAFARGEFSPRRILRSCKLTMIQPSDQSILSNRNTP